jgi:hypothetical protein
MSCKLHGLSSCSYCATRALEAQTARMTPARVARFQTFAPQTGNGKRGAK